ncbi:MAG: cbb3-type cytochrome c oxidase subunit II [Verrucomicrobiota bacterium]
MNHGPLIFLGILFTMALSWCGLVFAPQIQFGRQEVVNAKGQLYPPNRPGLAQQGKEVYRANGCQYCHSQQVQPKGLGADFQRGWGKRYSVAQDYLRDVPVMLGNLRIGPDLTNVGLRRPDDETHTNLVWHLQHLYSPQSTSPGSIMPPYPFLFEKRPVRHGQPASPDALPLTNQSRAEPGYEIVPTPAARALVAYLFSLQSETPLFEAPAPPEPGTGVDTNAPAAASTNVVGPASTSPPKP